MFPRIFRSSYFLHAPHPPAPSLPGNASTFTKWPNQWPHIRFLDLSLNELEGEVPEEWRQFGSFADRRGADRATRFNFSHNQMDLSVLSTDLVQDVCAVQSVTWDFKNNSVPNESGYIIDRSGSFWDQLNHSTNICLDHEAPRVLIIVWGTFFMVVIAGYIILWISLRTCFRFLYNAANKPRQPVTRKGPIGWLLRFMGSPASTKLRMFCEVWFWLLDIGTDILWLLAVPSIPTYSVVGGIFVLQQCFAVYLVQEHCHKRYMRYKQLDF